MIPWAKPAFFGNEIQMVTDALKSTWISGGPYLDRLEKNFSKLLSVDHAISTSNGTTALSLALLGLGIKQGDEIIMPGFCFVAVANVTSQIGAKPLFADVDEETWNMKPSEIRRLITPKTKAILVVHNYGNVCEMDEIMEIAKENSLYVVEDAAEAPFSKYNGKYVGTFGDLGCFSFQATKTITTGEGGAVISNNKKLIETMRIIRNHGLATRGNYKHEIAGFNFRLTNIQAALGCAQLEKIDEILEKKKSIYNKYKQKLGNLNEITFQKINPQVEPIIWAVAFKLNSGKWLNKRDELIEKLKEEGVETRPGFYPLHKLPMYPNSPELPISEKISSQILSIPSFTTLSENEIEYVCDKIKNLLN